MKYLITIACITLTMLFGMNTNAQTLPTSQFGLSCFTFTGNANAGPANDIGEEWSGLAPGIAVSQNGLVGFQNYVTGTFSTNADPITDGPGPIPYQDVEAITYLDGYSYMFLSEDYVQAGFPYALTIIDDIYSLNDGIQWQYGLSISNWCANMGTDPNCVGEYNYEGLTYNPNLNQLFVANEKNPPALFMIDQFGMGNLPPDGVTLTDDLTDAYQSPVPLDISMLNLQGGDIAGLHHLGQNPESVGTDYANNILILSQENAMIYEVNLTTGVLIDQLDLNQFGLNNLTQPMGCNPDVPGVPFKPEGIAYANGTIHLVSDNASCLASFAFDKNPVSPIVSVTAGNFDAAVSVSNVPNGTLINWELLEGGYPYNQVQSGTSASPNFSVSNLMGCTDYSISVSIETTDCGIMEVNELFATTESPLSFSVIIPSPASVFAAITPLPQINNYYYEISPTGQSTPVISGYFGTSFLSDFILQPCTQYDITAYYDDGCGAVTQTFSTECVACNSTPTSYNLPVSAYPSGYDTDTELILTYDFYVNATSFEAEYWDVDYPGTTTVTSVPGGTPQIFLSGLNPCTTYGWKVRVECAPGVYTPWSNVSYSITTGPTCRIVNAGMPDEGVVVDHTDFESGWGIWNDKGLDCRRHYADRNFTQQGDYCVRLRDNTWTSRTDSDPIDLSAFDKVVVHFSYRAAGMDANERFRFQVKNNTTHYATKATWSKGAHYQNGVFYNEAVELNGPFASDTRFRFRSYGSVDADRVYIDNIIIVGYGDNSSSKVTESAPSMETLPTSSMSVSPNPNYGNFNVNINSSEEQEVRLSVFSINGTLVHEELNLLDQGTNQLRFDLGDTLTKGIYFITMDNGTEVITKKVMIQR